MFRYFEKRKKRRLVKAITALCNEVLTDQFSEPIGISDYSYPVAVDEVARGLSAIYGIEAHKSDIRKIREDQAGRQAGIYRQVYAQLNETTQFFVEPLNRVLERRLSNFVLVDLDNPYQRENLALVAAQTVQAVDEMIKKNMHLPNYTFRAYDVMTLARKHLDVQASFDYPPLRELDLHLRLKQKVRSKIGGLKL